MVINIEKSLAQHTSFARPLKCTDYRDYQTGDFRTDQTVFKPKVNASGYSVEKATCEDSFHCGHSFSSLTAARLWLSKNGTNVDINSFWHGYLCRIGAEL